MLCHTLLLLSSAALVLGHGRVTQPPSRASAWRYGFPIPANYDDDGLNCGGFSTQWSGNGGKCGICGDAYSIPTPRPHELGGTYGLGLIVATYLPGAVIATTTHLTASHMGYWEFKLCPDPTDDSQECFDRHLLELENGDTKYTPNRGSGIYNVNYKLPGGLVCEHCVLQWRYVAGNNWGVCNNGTSGLGCGNQEEFRACSDIAIGMSKTLSDEAIGNKVPSPLIFYLQNGYYEMNQGYLTDPKRPTRPQRPANTKPSKRQPKPTQLQPNFSQQHSNPSQQQTNPSQWQPNPSQQLLNLFQQYSKPSQQANPTQRQPNHSQVLPNYSQGHPNFSQLQPNQSPSQRQPNKSQRQPKPSKQQPNPSQRLPNQSQRLSQSQRQTKPSKQQHNHQRQPKPHKQQRNPSQQQPNPYRQPKPSHRHPNSSQRHSKQLEHNNKQKTKQKAKSKKRKKTHHGNKKTRNQRYNFF